MTECADERRIVEMSRFGSIRLSLTPSVHVGCTRGTILIDDSCMPAIFVVMALAGKIESKS